jgi:quercetin dioxygenase-like cupin family protein
MKVERSANVAKKPVTVEGAEGVEIRWLIAKEDGAPNFAMRMFEIAPGGHTPLHRHPHEHEVFVVEGAGVFVHEGADYPIARDDVVFVPGGDEHCFKNTGSAALRMLCLIPLSGA